MAMSQIVEVDEIAGDDRKLEEKATELVRASYVLLFPSLKLLS